MIAFEWFPFITFWYPEAVYLKHKGWEIGEGIVSKDTFEKVQREMESRKRVVQNEDGTITLPDGSVIKPLDDTHPAYKMYKQWQDYYAKHPEVLYPSQNAWGRQMEGMANSLKSTQVVNNNKSSSYNVGDIHVHCSGITSKDVAEQAAREINRQIFGLSGQAQQFASITR